MTKTVQTPQNIRTKKHWFIVKIKNNATKCIDVKIIYCDTWEQAKQIRNIIRLLWM